MSRIRSIKPEWLDDERMAMASPEARVLSIALIILSDDYGNGRANLTMLGGRAFPGHDNPREVLAKALDELVSLAFVVPYEVDGQSYYSIRNWEKHQRVDKPGKPHVPPPPADKPKNKAKHPRETLAKIPGSLAKVPETLAPDQDQEGIKDQERERERESAGEPAAHVVVSHGAEAMLRSLVAPTDADAAVAALVSETRQAAGGAPFRGTGFADRQAVQKLAEWAAATLTPPDRLRDVLVAFWAAKGTTARLSWLVEEEPGRFLGKPKVRGMAPPVSHGEFARQVAEAGATEGGYAAIAFK